MDATVVAHGLIGRDAEIEVVDRFLDRVAQRPVGLEMEGEAGIGKTSLWRAAVAAAGRRRLHVLTARPAQPEAGLSLAGLADLLDGIDHRSRLALPDPQRRALDIALLGAADDDPAVDQRTLCAAVLSLLRFLATQRPVVLAVDDVQWLDPSSVRVLAFAARRLRSAPVGILLSLRVGTTTDPLDLATALPGEDLTRMAVGPLGVGAVRRLVVSRAGLHLSHSAAARLHAATGGNPFFVMELARSLVGREAEMRPGQPLAVPEDLSALIRQRLGALPDAARRAVMVVAAASDPGMGLVEAVMAPVGGEAVARALAAGALEAEGDRLRLAHPLLGSTVYFDAPMAERRRLHARLALAVADPEDRARHLALAAAGPDAAVADALEAGAGVAARRGAPDAAAELCEEARRFTPASEPGESCRRAVVAAGHHFAAGAWGRSTVLLEEVIDAAEPGRVRAEALRLRGELAYHDGSVPDAARLLGLGLEAADGDRGLRAAIHLDRAFALELMGDVAGAQRHGHAAVAEAEQPDLMAQALAVSVIVDFMAGEGIDEARLRRALALENPRHPTVMVMRPTCIAAILDMWTGRLEAARARFGRLHQMMVEQGQEALWAMASPHAVQLACWMGDIGLATRWVEAGLETSAQVGGSLVRGHALAAQCLLHAHVGEADLVRDEARQALFVYEGAGLALHVMWPRWALALIELSTGDAAAADRAIGPLVETFLSTGNSEPMSAPFVPDEIEALVGLGHLDEAATLLAGFEAQGRAHRRPWALATGARCRALLLAARGDLDGASEAVEEAMGHHAGLPMPLEQGRTLLVRGQLQRRQRQKRAATGSLNQALEVFETVHACGWAARARRELGRVGLRPRAPRELTETEDRVAELAAGGLTTRAIAAEVFASPKTVEGVLGRVYRKLDVHSRAELAARWAQGQISSPLTPAVPPGADVNGRRR